MNGGSSERAARRRHGLAFAFVVVALTLAACGGSDEQADTSDTTRPRGTGSTTTTTDRSNGDRTTTTEKESDTGDTTTTGNTEPGDTTSSTATTLVGNVTTTPVGGTPSTVGNPPTTVRRTTTTVRHTTTTQPKTTTTVSNLPECGQDYHILWKPGHEHALCQVTTGPKEFRGIQTALLPNLPSITCASLAAQGMQVVHTVAPNNDPLGFGYDTDTFVACQG